MDGPLIIRKTEQQVLFAGEWGGGCWVPAALLSTIKCLQYRRAIVSFKRKWKPSPSSSLSIPASSSWFYFGNAPWRPLVFLFLFRQIHPLGRVFFFFLQTRLPLSFPRVCRVFVLITFLVMFWRDWKCDFPDSQRQGVTWPAFPHRSPCGECVYSRPGDDGKNTPLVHSLAVKT